MPAEVDWWRQHILVIRCDAATTGVDSCSRWDYDLHVGDSLGDERHEPRASCPGIELPRVRVSRLYFLLPLYGADGNHCYPYTAATAIGIVDTLQGVIFWSLLLSGCDYIAND